MSEQIITLGWFSPVENPLLDAYPSVKFSGVLLNTRPVLVLDVATARAIASRLPHDEVLPIGQIRKNIFGVLDSDVPSEGPGPEDETEEEKWFDAGRLSQRHEYGASPEAVNRLVDAARGVIVGGTFSQPVIDDLEKLAHALAPFREPKTKYAPAGGPGPEDIADLVKAANDFVNHQCGETEVFLRRALAPWRESEADARKAGEKGEPV